MFIHRSRLIPICRINFELCIDERNQYCLISEYLTMPMYTIMDRNFSSSPTFTFRHNDSLLFQIVSANLFVSRTMILSKGLVKKSRKQYNGVISFCIGGRFVKQFSKLGPVNSGGDSLKVPFRQTVSCFTPCLAFQHSRTPSGGIFCTSCSEF